MGAINRVACLIGGCGATAIEGRAFCAEHGKQAENPDAYPLPKGWAKLREVVRARDVYCQWPGCSALVAEIDHIIPRDEGGDDDLQNLQGLCKPCHATKTVLDKSRNQKVKAIRFMLQTPDPAKRKTIELAGGIIYDEPGLIRQVTWPLRIGTWAELIESVRVNLRRAVLGGLILNQMMPAYCILGGDVAIVERLARWLRA